MYKLLVDLLTPIAFLQTRALVYDDEFIVWLTLGSCDDMVDQDLLCLLVFLIVHKGWLCYGVFYEYAINWWYINMCNPRLRVSNIQFKLK